MVKLGACVALSTKTRYTGPQVRCPCFSETPCWEARIKESFVNSDTDVGEIGGIRLMTSGGHCRSLRTTPYAVEVSRLDAVEMHAYMNCPLPMTTNPSFSQAFLPDSRIKPCHKVRKPQSQALAAPHPCDALRWMSHSRQWQRSLLPS